MLLVLFIYVVCSNCLAFNQMDVQASCGRPLVEENCFIFLLFLNGSLEQTLQPILEGLF